MTTKQILTQLRELLGTPEHWTQREMARTQMNYATSPLAPDAASFCLAGGLCHITKDMLGRSAEYVTARDAIAAAAGCTIVAFNDRSTYEVVLATLEKAIASCP
jgi:hypothetical protein